MQGCQLCVQHPHNPPTRVATCREEIAAFNDPTIMHKLQMQLAIAEERFEDATT